MKIFIPLSLEFKDSHTARLSAADPLCFGATGLVINRILTQMFFLPPFSHFSFLRVPVKALRQHPTLISLCFQSYVMILHYILVNPHPLLL